MKFQSVWVVRMTTALTFFIGIAAFVLSFSAVRALAVSNNVPDNLAWLFPLLADAVVIAAGLSVIGQHLENENARYQWALVIVFTALSVVLNFLHAPADWTARGLSVVPPIALFLTFELLSVQIRRSADRSQKQDTLAALSKRIDEMKRGQADFERIAAERAAKLEREYADKRAALEQQITDMTARRDKLAQDIDRLKADKRAARQTRDADTSGTTDPLSAKPAPNVLSPVQRREMILRDIRTANGHGAPSAESLADKYGVSVKTIKRDLLELAHDTTEAN